MQPRAHGRPTLHLLEIERWTLRNTASKTPRQLVIMSTRHKAIYTTRWSQVLRDNMLGVLLGLDYRDACKLYDVDSLLPFRCLAPGGINPLSLSLSRSAWLAYCATFPTGTLSHSLCCQHKCSNATWTLRSREWGRRNIKRDQLLRVFMPSTLLFPPQSYPQQSTIGWLVTFVGWVDLNWAVQPIGWLTAGCVNQ